MAIHCIIKNKQDRATVIKKVIQKSGGEFRGYYGLIGAEHDAVIFSKVLDLSNYVSVLAKTLLSVALKDIKTVHRYTG
ncbi:MAG: hypothetical protein CL532_07395 [Aestuariivita sp.]|nr:hypothetical protein [Aestuariivita sp.]